MDLRRRLLGLTAVGAVALIVVGASLGLPRHSPDSSGGPAPAPSPPAKNTVELEEFLFVLNPHLKEVKGAIHLLWIPKPVQRLCLGKTAKQCSTIDYCIRTTDKEASLCQDLGMDLAKLPAYPPDMRPRRQLSIVVFPAAQVKGLDALRTYFDSRQPRNALDRLSMSARIKARIKLIRSADDDFELLEVLALPPL